MSESSDVKTEEIEISKIDLDLENPRHEPLVSEAEAISYLCTDEQVYELAKDIVKNGINPMELFGFVQNGQRYFTAEGNRRLCAIKILNNPELAPDEYKERFATLSLGWQPMHALKGVVFTDREDVALWLERIHGGASRGRGRRQWGAEQKARHLGKSRNDLAITLLDWGELEGLISAEERDGRMSVVQRHVSNPTFRQSVGVETVDGLHLRYFNESDFRHVMGVFLSDVAKRRLNTRANAEAVRAYALKLAQIEGYPSAKLDDGELILEQQLAAQRSEGADTNEEALINTEGRDISSSTETSISETEISADTTSIGKSVSSPVRRPTRPRRIPQSEQLKGALEALGDDAYKSKCLYYSICAIDAAKHTPLLSVGIWSLVESLTALAGRTTDFPSYLSYKRLEELGVKKQREVRHAIQRFSEEGNTTKHSAISAYYNTEQLINDFLAIEEMLICLVENMLEDEEVS